MCATCSVERILHHKGTLKGVLPFWPYNNVLRTDAHILDMVFQQWRFTLSFFATHKRTSAAVNCFSSCSSITETFICGKRLFYLFILNLFVVALFKWEFHNKQALSTTPSLYCQGKPESMLCQYFTC